MNRYGLRARVITLTLAPTLIIGLALCAFFSFNRYQDLENQVINAGSNIIEPLAIASEESLRNQSRESVRRIISYAHRKNSQFVRSIAVFDSKHQLFVTSNFHPNFESLTFARNKPIPTLGTAVMKDNHTLILRTPILAESRLIDGSTDVRRIPVLGYIAIELDLSSLRLQQYQEIFAAIMVLILGLALSGLFAFRLMYDVTRPITHMKNMLDRIRRGHLDVRIEGTMHGELDELKKGINAMAASLSEYHGEMQHSIDQATSDLRETLEQLEIQNVELDIAKKHAQEAARVKSEFLANMSHELRTPLNGVIGFTRQMLKTQLSKNQQDYLQTIEKSANNLLNIINDILDFSKLEAGKLALENIPFEFEQNLEEVIDLLATSAHEKGLEITLRVDPNIPIGLVGDPLRIQQVLTNLVGNAIKFTESGNIDITIEQKSVHDDCFELLFSVRDTGIGISERQQAQLFQAFSQADASISRRYGGTGLGLVITQKIVSQMGGKIGLTSRLHQGSTFWFNLHLTKTEIPISDWFDPKPLAGSSVLLIETNKRVKRLLQKTLESVGINVTSVNEVPTNSGLYDYVIYNLALSSNNSLITIEPKVRQVLNLAPNVIIGTPSTELALAEYLMKHHPVKCVTKPLSRKKIIQAMLDLHPVKSDRSIDLVSPPNLDKLPLKVMAVDDNPANLKLITALLCERVKSVVSCTNGQDAIEESIKQKFDIILMDIQMPQIDGVSASKEIKRQSFNSDTPIIAVTAHAMPGERERLLNEGMDDYLTKPIEEHVLQQVLVHWNPYPYEHQIEKLEIPATQPVSDNMSSNLKSGQELSVIDWESALKQAANKLDLAQDMLRMLVDSIPEIVIHIDQTIAGKIEHKDLLQHIHKLHGSCAYCGVPRLKKICAVIEHALRQNKTVEELEPELFELLEEMEKVVDEAKSYIS
ncbi:two-component sensor histidine kinase BarA [Vibrio sp. WJH972]